MELPRSMARIFLSHASQDDLEAIALHDWLAGEGWSDVFLDIDPVGGIAAGERWERALHEAASRCEAVLFLVTPRWLASGWCMKEYALARGLNKLLFAVVVDPGLSVTDLPQELKGTWQVVALAGGHDVQLFRAHRPNSRDEKHVAFSRDGLRMLKRGLEKAGLDPRFFPWPPTADPTRAPYRGLRALEAADAGVFFGREAPIVAGIDRLRALKEGAAPRLLVVLGASGSGKSSFLRAGLLPRLMRADAEFVCLAPIRPERAALTGENGLIGALQRAFPDRARAALREAALAGAQGVRPLLRELTQGAATRASIDSEGRKAPTLILAVDQAEELFSAEGEPEAAPLLAALRDLAATDDPSVIVVFVIRSDSYDRLEHAEALAGMPQATMPLLPLPRGAYKNVIEGPAARVELTGGKLAVEPRLTQRLLEDVEKGGGGDALPLLAFALEQLYIEFGAGGALRLADFESLGGFEGSLDKAVERAFARADADRRIPLERSAREALLRRGLVPWLAGIDPSTRAPRRNIALKSDIPPEARPLIDLLVEERLLIADTALRDGERVETLEPAHEALLRQWGLLRGWLADDLGSLTTLEGVRRASLDWEANGRADGWLAHRGGRLAEASALDARPDLSAQFDGRDRAYLEVCSAREAAAAAERERARAAELARAKAEAERARAGQRFARNLTILASIAALALAGLGAWAWTQRNAAIDQRAAAEEQRKLAEERSAEAQEQRRQADEARKLSDSQRREAVLRLAAADELLDPDKATTMRQCIATTQRMAARPLPAANRDFFVGLWHVDQGGSSTYMDWRADGACESKSVFTTENPFSGGSTPLDLKGDVCTWSYSQIGDNAFEIDYQSKLLGADFPKRLLFRIVDPTRIHNYDLNYDAFRIVCPAQEQPLLRAEVAAAQARADADPKNAATAIAAATAHRQLGSILLQQNDQAGAIAEFSTAIAIYRNVSAAAEPASPQRRQLMSTLFSLGEAQRATHETAAARDAFRQGVDIGQSVADASPTDTTASLPLVVGLYELSQISDPPEAKGALQRAVAILDDLKASNPLDPRFASLGAVFEEALRKLP